VETNVMYVHKQMAALCVRLDTIQILITQWIAFLVRRIVLLVVLQPALLV
jgi:hypothetical protein